MTTDDTITLTDVARQRRHDASTAPRRRSAVPALGGRGQVSDGLDGLPVGSRAADIYTAQNLHVVAGLR